MELFHLEKGRLIAILTAFQWRISVLSNVFCITNLCLQLCLCLDTSGNHCRGYEGNMNFYYGTAIVNGHIFSQLAHTRSR